MTLLWHAHEPIGICVFTSPPLSLRQRNRYFGMTGRWSRTAIRSMNRQLVMLSRVVLHPTYRGAGLAPAFLRASCRACPWPWIETLAEMGHLNPCFEKAGFVRVGVCTKKSDRIEEHSALYGGRRNGKGQRILVSRETFEKSRHAEPIYYIFDNRTAEKRRVAASDPGERPGGRS